MPGPRELVYRRAVGVPAPRETTYAELERIGGRHGWPFANVLWQVRGWIDRLVGGPGMRGHPGVDRLLPGEALDFWRVEAVERPAALRLRAEMRLPGTAWLEFEVEGSGGTSHLVQTARFQPSGLAGELYWYGLLPIHAAIFRGMLRRIAARAARQDGEVTSDTGG